MCFGVWSLLFFRGCSSAPFEEVSQPAGLICSAASKEKSKEKKTQGGGVFSGGGVYLVGAGARRAASALKKIFFR